MLVDLMNLCDMLLSVVVNFGGSLCLVMLSMVGSVVFIVVLGVRFVVSVVECIKL